MSNHFKIKSNNNHYEVLFKNNLSYEECLNLGTHFLIDSNIVNLISLPNSIVIKASEDQKQYVNIVSIIETLVKTNFKKDSHLVVIGGGILQDIGCWIASIYMRGVKWSFIPTTLLAQADSCIGSKSSINFGEHKNLIGTFYPPEKVIIDSSFRHTLNKQDIDSGLAEIIKLFIIDGYNPNTIENACLNLDEAIYKALLIKKNFIEIDEYDKGPRNILNYGHCFGHAIESSSDYKIPHGIAVAMGIDIANLYSDKLYNDNSFNKFHRILKKIYMNHIHLCSSDESIVEAMKTDKKSTNKTINIIMPLGNNIIKKELPQTSQLRHDLLETIKEFKNYYANL